MKLFSVPLAVISILLSACAGSDAALLVEEVGELRVEVATLSEQIAGLESSLTVTPQSPDQPSTTIPANPTTSTTVATPSTTALSVDMGSLAVAFFVASETLCVMHSDLTGNSPPDSARYGNVAVVQVLDADRVEIRDGLDSQLIVDFGTEPATIYSSEGPDGILPLDLSFGCPPELYPGTLPS